MAPPEQLTRETALAMQDALIAEYTQPKFQQELRAVLGYAAGSSKKREMELELRKIRENVGAKFGYESSPEGVAKSIAAFTQDLRADPEIMEKCRQMEILLYPQRQDELALKANMTCSAYLENLLQNSNTQLEANRNSIKLQRGPSKSVPIWEGNPITEMPNRCWVVTGGNGKGGIVVRMGEGTSTLELAARLATGAKVREMGLAGSRLHYQKMSGEGPDFGWVTIWVKGMWLLEPIQVTEEEQQDLVEKAIVGCA